MFNPRLVSNPPATTHQTLHKIVFYKREKKRIHRVTPHMEGLQLECRNGKRKRFQMAVSQDVYPAYYEALVRRMRPSKDAAPCVRPEYGS